MIDNLSSSASYCLVAPRVLPPDLPGDEDRWRELSGSEEDWADGIRPRQMQSVTITKQPCRHYLLIRGSPQVPVPVFTLCATVALAAQALTSANVLIISISC